jgi:hypothetical protein
MHDMIKALGHLIRGQLVVCAYGLGMLALSWVLFRHG